MYQINNITPGSARKHAPEYWLVVKFFVLFHELTELSLDNFDRGHPVVLIMKL